MKKLALFIFVLILCAGCGSTRNDSFFYKGTITKANGERKQKTFIFGRDACVRKSKRMAKKRARQRSYDRNPVYGITSSGNARQRN